MLYLRREDLFLSETESLLTAEASEVLGPVGTPTPACVTVRFGSHPSDFTEYALTRTQRDSMGEDVLFWEYSQRQDPDVPDRVLIFND